jgi:uncharacterized alkaline shock family protein YloU
MMVTETKHGAVAGDTHIDDQVLGAIASVAAMEVEGVAGLGESSIRRSVAEVVGAAQSKTRGVTVEAGKKEAIVDLRVNIRYGYSIPKIVEQIRQRVSERLDSMAGLMAKEINISIVGIEFEKEQRISKVE